MPSTIGESVPPGEWVQDALLAGGDDEVCLWMGGPVTRGELARLVTAQEHRLAGAGLCAGGTVAIRVPPAVMYIATVLAAWRAGAQVCLLDHRLVHREVDRALRLLAPQVVVTAQRTHGVPLAGYARVSTRVAARPGGRPAATPHALIQLSSGSTGPSKVIARTAEDLLAELGRYAALAGYPGRGTRIVLLASMVHVLGLVGGLLHGLHAGAPLVFPERLTADGIRSAVTADAAPAVIIGVPFYAELLGTGGAPLRQLSRMIVAGELVRPTVAGTFTDRYAVPLGTMYGMTETGVIATDLAGEHAPALTPAPGVELRTDGGELLVRRPESPYIGPVDPGRWADGWLRTRDAATIDAATGQVTILGRLDSQVSIGGLKVDLTEVERELCALPQVDAAVVAFDGEIEAYLVLRGGASMTQVEAALARQLAAWKRPAVLYQLASLPRTATGKIVRDRVALRAAVAA